VLTTAPVDRPVVFSLPGYEEVTRIGKGGMGEVYKAFDPGLNGTSTLQRIAIRTNIRTQHRQGLLTLAAGKSEMQFDVRSRRS
jgi:hypothetical protein